MKPVESNVVVVTGASSGIGRATALRFAERGAAVVLIARDAAALRELAEECRQAGGEALPAAIDVSDEADVNRITQQAIEAFGHIDVWVNNAAVTTLGRLEDIPTDDIRRLLEVNVLGNIFGARAVLPHFKARGRGLLVNVASMVAITGQPYAVPYSVSKFAIRGLGLSLAQELADQPNIHVCTVLPAVIDTPLFNHAANYMGRAVQPPKPIVRAEEVAEAIVGLTEHPQKEVMVGNMGRLSRAMRALTPNLFDKQFRKMIENQHFQEQPAVSTPGNLYEPDRHGTTVSGGWKDDADGQSSSSVLKRVGQVAALGAGVAAAYLAASALRKPKEQNSDSDAGTAAAPAAAPEVMEVELVVVEVADPTVVI